MEEYARTALVNMLTSTVTDPALGEALARVGERQVVLDSLIEGLGPLVSTLLQVTLCQRRLKTDPGSSSES